MYIVQLNSQEHGYALKQSAARAGETTTTETTLKNTAPQRNTQHQLFHREREKPR